MPLNQGLLHDVAQRPFNFEPIFEDAGEYTGAVIPFAGRVTMGVFASGIKATILDDTNWKGRARQALPIELQHSSSAPFRRSANGQLITEDQHGEITSKELHALRVLFVDEKPVDDREDAYYFNVTFLERGDTSIEPAAVRLLFRRGAIQAGRNVFHGRSMVAHAFTDRELDIDYQRMSIVCDWAVAGNEAVAIEHAMSLVAGQSLQRVAMEGYAADGTLLWTRYQVMTNAGDRGREFFHRLHPGLGKLAAGGWGVISEGMYRLLEYGFPIEMVLYHLHHASRQPYDIDAQHLLLAIHTAFEAWNRHFGTRVWISNGKWKKLRRVLRAPMEALAEYVALIPEMHKNIRDGMGHANDTQMGWRQDQFFAALQIYIADDENARALGYRNEILHNGYFLKRWRTLTQAQRQQRIEDIERLRRLALLTVLKLTGYSGPYRNPVTNVAEQVDSSTLSLPAAIAAPVATANPPANATP